MNGKGWFGKPKKCVSFLELNLKGEGGGFRHLGKIPKKSSFFGGFPFKYDLGRDDSGKNVTRNRVC